MVSPIAPQKYAQLTHLGEIPIATFLEEYWQKKPLLIKNAFPNFTSPISGDELAGFSLEEDVISRLVIEHGLTGKTPWQVEHGPIDEQLYSRLPESHWTLLVQHADLLHPDITALLDAFRFIPNWRLDDIMISYAADQGSVGPHFDYYDVFLLQAEGKRRWRLGQQCNATSLMVHGLTMKVLAEFECSEDWIVEPGDLLYIPPGLAHWGEAQGDCMTYSIGFRAPSHNDLLLDFFTEQASNTCEDDRYSDPQLPLQSHPGEITPEAINALQSIIHRYANDEQALIKWFGAYMTTPNPTAEDFTPEPIELEQITANQLFQLAPHIRSAFFVGETHDSTHVFINGEHYLCSQTLAEQLSNYTAMQLNALNSADKKLIAEFCSREYLIWGF